MGDYDERQLGARHRFGFQAFFLNIILTFVNAFIIDMVYVWADNMVAGFTVIMISSAYFGLRTILAGAYFSRKPERNKMWLIVLTVISVFYAAVFALRLLNRHIEIVKDGRATTDLIFVIAVAMLIILCVFFWVKRPKD